MISVIIPAHNEEKYIERCIKFIQKASTHTSVETVVVCNRCTDSTADTADNLSICGAVWA
jgi:glycosyltransferase involved in cell wall biosynthesis